MEEVLLDSGQATLPIYEFERWDTTYYFDIDDHCLRLLIPHFRGDEYAYKPTICWFPEALEELQTIYHRIDFQSQELRHA